MMKIRPEKWIAAEIGWGAQHHETEWGPTDLANKLSIHYDKIIRCKTSFKNVHSLSYVQKLKEVEDVSQQVMQTVQEVLTEGYFPIVIGGDESIGIGTWSGAVLHYKAPKKFGLIWLDAHMDAHTPKTTPSKAIHGMPLAALLGSGEKTLVEMGGVAPKLDPKHVVLIGVRSYEEGESEFLREHNVKIYFMEEIQQRGIFAVVSEAVHYLEKFSIPFGVNIDLDVFDPLIMPAVGSPEPYGLRSIRETIKSINLIYEHPQFCALEISEYNPKFLNKKKRIKIIKKVLHPWLLNAHGKRK